VLAGAVDERLREWDAGDVAGRLRAKDTTLWSVDDVPELGDRLGWLDLPARAAGLFDDLTRIGVDVASAHATRIVLLGMGGSSLAPEVFQRTFGNARGRPRLEVLDTTHPAYIARMAGTIDIDRTIFIVSSKSGGTIETMSFFRYFWNAAAAQLDNPGRRFIAITDPGTALEKLAVARSFRRVVYAPADVGGRYAALSVFGLVPAAIIGVDVRAVIERVVASDQTATSMSQSAGGRLGAFLGAAWAAGKDKITLLTSASLAAFVHWAEQLVAESTGKKGRGLVPVVGEPVLAPRAYGSDRAFVVMTLDGEASPDVSAFVDAGFPLATMRLRERDDIGCAFFAWELATALAGCVLGVQPFDQPDVQLAKDFARRAMTGDTRVAGDTDSAEPAPVAGADFDGWLGDTRAGDYIAVQAFTAPGMAERTALTKVARALRQHTGLPVTFEFGPRFLHSTGQLHKGGANNGLFLQIVDQSMHAMSVPETEYSFDGLIRAQADGDAAALRARKRRLLRVAVDGSSARALEEIASALAR